MTRTPKCSICRLGPGETEFYTRLNGNFHDICHSCTRLRTAMRKPLPKPDGYKGHSFYQWPSYAEMRAVVGTPLAQVAEVSLTQAQHPGKSGSKQRHPKMIEADRLRREALADQAAKTEGWVYAIGEEDNEDFIKIGKSADHPKFRLKGLQTGNPRRLKVYGVKQVSDRQASERTLHAQFQKWNVLGEWFHLVPEIADEFGFTLETDRAESIA